MTPGKIFKASALAILMAVPAAHADDVKAIVGGIAKQYLQQEQDRATYSQAQSANTLSAYQGYLRQFPNGAYAAQARDHVRRMGGAVEAAPAGLTAQQRVQVQKRLNALGYATGGTDGTFGTGTRRAIALWQRDRNYAQTGTLTPAQSQEILGGRSTPVVVGGSAPRNEGRDVSASSAEKAERALGLSTAQRSAAQAGLTRRGFDTHGVDGSFGRGTRNAIANWQRANDLTATGYLTGPQFQRLTTR